MTAEQCVCGHARRLHWCDNGIEPTGKCDAANCGCSKYRPQSSNLESILRTCDPHDTDAVIKALNAAAAEIERLRATLTRLDTLTSSAFDKTAAIRGEIQAALTGAAHETDASRECELLNLIHEAMPYMLIAASSQKSPPAEWVRKASKAGGSLLAGYHAMNQSGVLPEKASETTAAKQWPMTRHVMGIGEPSEKTSAMPVCTCRCHTEKFRCEECCDGPSIPRPGEQFDAETKAAIYANPKDGDFV